MAQVGAANVIWVGDIKGIDTRELDYNTLMVSFNIEEDTTDGRFGKFLEDDVSFTTTDQDSRVVKIILDGVSAGIYADKVFEVKGLVESVSFKNLVGSFKNPEIRYTLSDREIFSAEITISSKYKLSLVRSPVLKTDTSKLSLGFKLIAVDDSTERVVPPDVRPANVLELTPDDFADPFPTNMIELSGDFRKQFDMLNSLPPESFVTFFYPLKNMRPSVARTLFTRKLSAWGWMEVSDDHGLLLITDYAGYVRSIVESLLVFDQPVPQVEVVAKVIEITMTDQESRGFIYSYSKEFPDKMDISLGQTGSPESSGLDGLSAAISHYSDGNLRTFMGMLDIAVKKGKANVLATPRALVLNNQTADFRVGETYYFYAPGNQSVSATEYDKINTNDSKESYDQVTTSNSSTLKTISSGVRMNVRPTIQNSQQITMYMSLAYDEVIGFSGPGQYPVLANRSLNTNVRLKAGQTLVIGGLFREKDVSMRKKVPGLGDIPGLGVLFSSKRSERIRSELVFVLTINQIR